jgi:hypothetical protein
MALSLWRGWPGWRSVGYCSVLDCRTSSRVESSAVVKGEQRDSFNSLVPSSPAQTCPDLLNVTPPPARQYHHHRTLHRQLTTPRTQASQVLPFCSKYPAQGAALYQAFIDLSLSELCLPA